MTDKLHRLFVRFARSPEKIELPNLEGKKDYFQEGRIFFKVRPSEDEKRIDELLNGRVITNHHSHAFYLIEGCVIETGDIGSGYIAYVTGNPFPYRYKANTHICGESVDRLNLVSRLLGFGDLDIR